MSGEEKLSVYGEFSRNEWDDLASAVEAVRDACSKVYDEHIPDNGTPEAPDVGFVVKLPGAASRIYEALASVFGDCSPLANLRRAAFGRRRAALADAFLDRVALFEKGVYRKWIHGSHRLERGMYALNTPLGDILAEWRALREVSEGCMFLHSFANAVYSVIAHTEECWRDTHATPAVDPEQRSGCTLRLSAELRKMRDLSVKMGGMLEEVDHTKVREKWISWGEVFTAVNEVCSLLEEQVRHLDWEGDPRLGYASCCPQLLVECHARVSDALRKQRVFLPHLMRNFKKSSCDENGNALREGVTEARELFSLLVRASDEALRDAEHYILVKVRDDDTDK